MRVNRQTLDELREYSKWKSSSSSGEFSLFDFICCVATPDLLFGFAEVFYPELVLHNGAYFIESRFDETTFEAWTKKGTELREIQRVMNHIHMSTLLQGQGVSPDVARAAAEAVASTWTRVFHDRDLVGEVIGEGLEDLAVTLCGTDHH